MQSRTVTCSRRRPDDGQRELCVNLQVTQASSTPKVSSIGRLPKGLFPAQMTGKPICTTDSSRARKWDAFELCHSLLLEGKPVSTPEARFRYLSLNDPTGSQNVTFPEGSAI